MTLFHSASAAKITSLRFSCWKECSPLYPAVSLLAFSTSKNTGGSNYEPSTPDIYPWPKSSYGTESGPIMF